MKKEPCIRLGIRISPKMREKPDESRNSRPPSATLFTAKVSHRLMCQYSLLLEVLGRRIIARINRVRQECLFLVGPELAHIRIGLDHRVYELAILLLAPADEDVADDIAIWIELDGTTRRIGQRHLVQGLGERRAVVGLGPESLDSGLDALAGH